MSPCNGDSYKLDVHHRRSPSDGAVPSSPNGDAPRLYDPDGVFIQSTTKIGPSRWSLFICSILFSTHIVMVVCGVTYGVVAFVTRKEENWVVAVVQITGVALCLLANIVFLVNFVGHIRRFVSSEIQRQYMRILLMVPILTIQSWFLLYAPFYDYFISPIAEGYKAFTLYCVLHVFLHYINQKDSLTHEIHQKLPIPQVLGFQKCFTPFLTCKRILRVTIIGTIQSIFLRPLSTVVIVVTAAVLEDAPIGFYFAKCLNVFQWASQCYAIYSVLVWARTFREDLYALSPLIKHFGLMFFHILLPTLVPQVMDIVIQYEIMDLEETQRKVHKHIYEISRGCFQSASAFLGSMYLLWMYSSRDTAYFLNSTRLSKSYAMSCILSMADVRMDYKLMKGACGECGPACKDKHESVHGVRSVAYEGPAASEDAHVAQSSVDDVALDSSDDHVNEEKAYHIVL